jgi:PAS domain S-box-containing protein
MKWLYLRNWSLRAKLAALMVVVSLLPLAISAYLDIRESRARLVAGVEALLGARAEQIVHEFDSTHQGYVRTVARLARLPDAAAYCGGSDHDREALRSRVLRVLETFPASDKDIRGAGVIDRSGIVLVATEPVLNGKDFSTRSTIRSALAGSPVISSVYLSTSGTGEQPTVAYLLPVRDAKGFVVCAVGVWVHADAFWRALRTSDGLAGNGSYAVLLDSAGIRIAYTHAQASVYRPAGPLAPALVNALVAEKRYGEHTRQLLEDVIPFPAQFERARSAVVDPAAFRGFSPSNQKWNFGVGRRLTSVPWTVFYMAPEDLLDAQLDADAREKALVALGIIALALIAGAVFAASILRPVRALSSATASLAGGAADARVRVRGDDELQRLGASFNAMADQLKSQSEALKQSHAQLEERIRERTGLLHAVIDNSPAIIAVKNLDGRYVLVNEKFSEMFHRTQDEVVGKTNQELFERAVADALAPMQERATRSAKALTEEEYVPHESGQRIFQSVTCPLRDASGNIYGIVTVSADITERKLAESKQLAQLARLNLLGQITTAIGEKLDLRSIYHVVNRSLKERMPVDFACICNYDDASKMLTVVRAGSLNEQVAADLQLTEQTRIPVDGNGLARCVQGELVYEAEIKDSQFAFPRRLAHAGLRSVVIAPLAAEKRVFGVLIAARLAPGAFSSGDCEFLRQLCGHVALAAQQAELNEALRNAYEDLRQSQQAVLQKARLSALGQMASGIAHDINNAISPAALYAETLLEREPGLSDKARNYLEIIARAIDDVAATVARMREFYRERAHQATLLPINLNPLVQQVIDLTHARWSDMPQQRGTSIELKLELAPALPLVMGIESEIREALINLVFNAVDAMPAGGTLTIRTRADSLAKSVDLQVRDSGIGMDAETRQRCLEPFFTTKGERGTGLGLAMVYGVAQRHDAEIDIDSALGQGTTIRLRFQAQLEEITALPDVRQTATVRPLRILVVDDDPMLIQSLRDTLKADGHDVVTAEGGKAGIAQFGANAGSGTRFDVVITDLGMPNVDGRQVAAAVKKASSATPVVLLTGWGQRLAEDGSEMPDHVDKVLGKPPKLRELRLALAQLVPPSGESRG